MDWKTLVYHTPVPIHYTYIRAERVTYLAGFDDNVCWLVYWKVWGGRFPIPGPLIRPWVMAASHLSSLKIYIGNHRMKYLEENVSERVLRNRICPDRYKGSLNPGHNLGQWIWIKEVSESGYNWVSESGFKILIQGTGPKTDANLCFKELHIFC